MKPLGVTTGFAVLLAMFAGCDSASTEGSSRTDSDSRTASAGATKTNVSAPPAAALQPAAQPAKTSPANPPGAANAAGPRWAIDAPRHDFGAVWAGETVQHTFEFKNVGSQVLRILEAKPRCSCSVADNYTREVPPGGTGRIPFVLKTNNKPNGPVEEYLTIKTNDASQPDMQIYLVGTIKTVCHTQVVQDWQATTPAELDKIKSSQGFFNRVSTNDRPFRVVRLTNTTGSPLELQMLQVGLSRLDTDGGASMVETPFEFSVNEITPNQVWELIITGKPPFPVGRVTSNVTFHTGIPDQPRFVVHASAYNPPRIEIVPQKIVHMAGAKPKGNARTIAITNNGTTPFAITAVAASTPEYTVRVLPRDPAKPTQTTVEVKFPFEGYVPPPYGELIRIETNDPEHPVIERMVLPTFNAATPRPADKPVQWHAGSVSG